ncbi:MAG TPA: Trp family transcriptional regulator [Candidatus Paceibacterota bacterium]
MKVQAKNLTDKQRIEILDALYAAAGSIKGKSEAKRFFNSLLTESERLMLGRRVLIKDRLAAGKSQRSIAEELGVGLDTIGKIAR